MVGVLGACRMMPGNAVWPLIVQVTCHVPWCRAVRYVETSRVQVLAVEHWERVHPRRLRAARARGGRR
jgi:hypothetical protein